MKKAIGASVAVMALALFAAGVFAITETISATAETTIEETCGLSITAGNPIAFGQLIAGGNPSLAQPVSVKNTGSVSTTGFTVYGDGWQTNPVTVPMDVSRTSVSDDNELSWTNLALSSSPVPIFDGIVLNGETKIPEFRLSIPAGQAAGTYTQTITFTASC
ncbi:MAG TPA: hypothetical protein VI968_00830 [archaeon]|nr:hypothetical protein [archaeon]